MKRIIATFLLCIVFGFIIILGYAIILNADGITEAFLSFPLPYLFWFILGILVGGVVAPFIYDHFRLFAKSRNNSDEMDLE